MSTITETLDTIKAFLWEHVPYHKNFTFAPATQAEIHTFETLTGFTLDPQLVEFLTHCDFRLDFDGNFIYEGPKTCFDGWARTAKMIDQGTFDGWKEKMEQKGFDNWKHNKLQPVYTSKKWVPFASDGCGNEFCIDHDPGPAGVHGQVINMEWQDGQGPYWSMPCLADYLQFQLRCLQQFQWTTEQYGETEDDVLVEIDSYLKPQDTPRN